MLSLFMSLYGSSLLASHIMGGDMALRHISGERFNLKLDLYYDGINGQDDVEDSIKVAAFNRLTNEFVKEFILARPNRYERAPYNFPACSKEGLDVRVYSYSNEVFLEDNLFSSSDGYYLSWQRCCRSNVISNLSGSEIEGFLYYMEIPSQLEYSENSSPVFNPLKGDFLCIGETGILDFSARDANGDSLKYEMIVPSAGFSTPNDNVIAGQPGPYPLVSGFSATPGLNSSSLSNNGIIEFTPTAQGVFQIAVRCEEFRNGIKLGEVTREMQFLVKDCGENEEPRVRFFNNDVTIEYTDEDTILIETQDDLCFKVRVDDVNVDDLFYLNFSSISTEGLLPVISPPNGILSDNGSQIVDFCFPTCKNTEITYFEGLLEVRDNFCPQPGRGQLNLNFKVIQSENRPPEIDTDFLDIIYEQKNEIKFKIYANDPDSADELSINMEGVGFSPESLNMLLVNEGESDNNSMEAIFTWIPECVSPPEQGKFILVFTVEDQNCGIGGLDTLHLAIRLNEYESQLFNNRPPNVITVNGDGFNDYFSIPELSNNNCLASNFESINIYNRWGRLVFNSKEIDFRWQPSEPAGDYFYILNLGEPHYKGIIKVMR